MRPQPNDRPICDNCRFLEEHISAEERSRLRSWCRIWRLLIPDPAHTGCTEFQPRSPSAEEVERP
jgi:hypothetical protein